MPQCIAQQDQSPWLSTMTKCTGHRCTNWFIWCTHQQWLTQLTCLKTEFSHDVIAPYLQYCGRSILAKAQLYQWIRAVTGRTWLISPGDATRLQNLSPSSLAKGYAALEATDHAPACLTDSTLSIELFQHIIASCSFTATSQHTGNAARPWEYSGSLKSMVALDSETAGYDLTWGRIGHGNYFDKECFCSTFAYDPNNEPCSGLDLTKERLWIHATCGSMSLPYNWMDKLKIMGFAYVRIEEWYWSVNVADMSKQVVELTDRCVTDACEVHADGYCKVKRVVDRACFCRDISYDSCGDSCHIFETRIDYVKWLHELCGNVQDWHGLPDNWRQLAAPNPLDMIPWRWTIKSTEACVSNEWKLRSFALINVATLIAAFLSHGRSTHRLVPGFLWHPHPGSWFAKGTLIVALQLLANWFNTFLIQTTPGYEDIPFVQLMLLWVSLPRLTWLTILLIGVRSPEALDSSAASSSLFAELTFQFLSSYYMGMTIDYGRKYNFYSGGLKNAERGKPAQLMYVGALIWLVVVCLALVGLIIAATYWIEKSWRSETTPLMRRSKGGAYGTFPGAGQNDRVSGIKTLVALFQILVIGMILLWVAQWLFWDGFIRVSSEEFCPPKLGILAFVWATSSFAGVVVAAT
ncbi:hypothetical protein EV127DRAFT_117508 [Xylaria flabelliformis]|nr:hypothetical protein EV127DRAFT_117508 [Xylaria flabelliformis]